MALALASYGLAGCERTQTRVAMVPVPPAPCMTEEEVARVEAAMVRLYSTPAVDCRTPQGVVTPGLCFPDPDGHSVSADIASIVDFARDRVARCPS